MGKSNTEEQCLFAGKIKTFIKVSVYIKLTVNALFDVIEMRLFVLFLSFQNASGHS